MDHDQHDKHDKRTSMQSEGTPESAWQAWPGLAALPAIRAETLVPPGSRALIVAPHPDDEVLGTGGLLAQLAGLGRELAIVAVTDGTGSHRGSPSWTPELLARTRTMETHEALRRLQTPDVSVLRAGLPDGSVAQHEAALAAFLADHLRPTDCVFATWRHDGHPDHEAVGRVAAAAVRECGATLIEVPVWTWHWAQPGDARVPWERARRLLLDDTVWARKKAATAAYASQLGPDASNHRAAILPPAVLARLLRPFEVFLVGIAGLID
jgi:LmbE family N-acetylglucosaminyl deacetylase